MSRFRAFVVDPLRAFLQTEAAGGVVLLVAVAAALAWANRPLPGSFESYRAVWEHTIGRGAFELTIREWVNEGVMTLFFFVVGLEIKREFATGELRDPRNASLPIIGAVGGMVVPAVVYLAFNRSGPNSRGWAIPTATDIAFAVGILALLGPRIPRQLKVFLLTLAIADDLGGIVIIAIFYPGRTSVVWLGATFAALTLFVGTRRYVLVYPLVALVVWVTTFRSGIHPALAGAALGLLTPARPARGKPILDGLERRLHPISSFAVVPLFALANSGIPIEAEALRSAASSPIFAGVVAGHLVGKPVGIAIATAAAVFLGVGRLPSGTGVVHMAGVCVIAGIGFTVALFIAGLAFAAVDDTLAATVGIFASSLVAAVVGMAILALARPAGQAASKSMSA